MKELVLNMMEELQGNVGVYYKDLTTGESFGIRDDEQYLAASVIKLMVLLEAFKQESQGEISFDQLVEINESDKLPSCGSLTYMHNGLKVTIMDLCVLMIIQSDNTATNIMIKLLGMDAINTTIKELGFERTKLNRLLFDSEEQKKGKENYISPMEMGIFLEKLYKGELISEKASLAMLDIMKKQQLNHKIPYYIPKAVKIAHKTGEDDGITNDVALVFSEKPFIICFTAYGTNVQMTEEFYRKSAKLCYDLSMKR